MQQSAIFCLGIFLAFILNSCRSSSKYTQDFKTNKRKVDSLAIIQPCIFVESVKDRTYSEDTSAERILEKKIFAKTQSILAEKYVLTFHPTITDSIRKNHLNQLFLTLDSSGKELGTIETPAFLKNIISNIPKRYCLMLFFQ